MTVRNSIAALLALFVMSGVACSVGESELEAMTLRPLAGQVEIHRGNEVINVTADEALEPQDVVVTGKDGLATLQLEEDNTVTMTRNTRLRIRTTSSVEGEEGSLIAQGAGETMKVLFDGVEAKLSDATLRLDRGFGSSRAASYDGTVQLSAPGEADLALRTLYEVDVAAGDLPDAPSPYELDLQDALDQDYLAEVITLTRNLELRANGFSRQLGGARPSLAGFSGLVGKPNVSFVKGYLSRPPADLLVAFTIATNDEKLGLENSFERAFDLRDQGSRWGVAATIMEVEPQALVAQLDRLILGTGVLADGTGGSADFTFASAAGDAVPSGDAPGSDGDTPDTITGDTGNVGSDGNDDGNGSIDGSGDSDDCENTVDCAVQDVEDELPPGPAPDPDPQETPRNANLLDDPPGVP